MAAGTIEKVIPDDDGNIQRGIAEAEIYANGTAPDIASNVVEVGRVFTGPSLQAFENILLARQRNLQAAALGRLTVHNPDFQFRKPDIPIHRD